MSEHPASAAGRRSREAAMAHDKQAWLDNFADDAVVEDPIGPSHFDPEGKGHRGKTEIAAFWDQAIGPNELSFHFTDSFRCGDEEANVGHISIVTNGLQVTCEGVFTYRVNAEGKLAALRAYWELERAAATARALD